MTCIYCDKTNNGDGNPFVVLLVPGAERAKKITIKNLNLNKKMSVQKLMKKHKKSLKRGGYRYYKDGIETENTNKLFFAKLDYMDEKDYKKNF